MRNAVERLRSVRRSAHRRWLGLAVAVVVGLLFASVHWVGLVVGGALTGLLARSPRRGVIAGFAFGVLAWATFVASLALSGAAAEYVAMGQVFYLSVAVPVVAGTLGGLVRFAV